MIRYYLIGFIFFIFSCSSKVDKIEKVERIQNAKTNNYTFEVLPFENGWGYKISENQKPFIIQKTIPAIQGTKGFRDNQSAKKCAELVVNKLENGVFPPTITKEELDSLGLIN